MTNILAYSIIASSCFQKCLFWSPQFSTGGKINSLSPQKNPPIRKITPAGGRPLLRQTLMMNVCHDRVNWSTSWGTLIYIIKHLHSIARPGGAMVARLTPDQKVACSNHIRVILSRSCNNINITLFITWSRSTQGYFYTFWGRNPSLHKQNT